MSGLPIRVRISLGFAAALTVMLLAVGLVAYHLLAAGLSDDLDRELQQRAQDLSGPVSRDGSSLRDVAGTGFIERGESFAEVLSTRGAVLQATDTLHRRPLLSRGEAARAARGSLVLDRPDAPGLNEPARLLATPVLRGGRPVLLVVGDTRENGNEVLRRTRKELAVGLPLILLLTSALGYVLVGAALRPVEAMRRRAAVMSVGATGQRLPLPPGNDEVARLGGTLNDLLARVDLALEREREFVTHASHELRTPLALLKTELELAVRRPRPAADLRRAIRSAEEEVDRLVRLAEHLLLLDNLDNRELSLTREQVDVSALLAGIAHRFAATAARDERALEVDADGVGSVEADARRLDQALVNLVDNAFAHGAGAVALTARTVPGAVEIRVNDEGDGFSAEMLTRGFERFVHGPSGAGSGLGLSIVAAVARAHGGSACVTNRPGGGSAASLRLPVAAATASPPSPARAPGSESLPADCGSDCDGDPGRQPAGDDVDHVVLPAVDQGGGHQHHVAEQRSTPQLVRHRPEEQGHEQRSPRVE